MLISFEPSEDCQPARLMCRNQDIQNNLPLRPVQASLADSLVDLVSQAVIAIADVRWGALLKLC